jgi:hypothetical protein
MKSTLLAASGEFSMIHIPLFLTFALLIGNVDQDNDDAVVSI